jgi:polysaccharide export outer membrane protein
MRNATWAGIVAALALGGCGVIYTAPDVSTGGGMNGGTEYDVEVVQLTPASAAAANLKPFVPPRLPLAFQPGAAAQQIARLPQQPDLGPLPQPTAARETRPTSISERFPPIAQPRPYRIGVSDVLVLSVTNGATSLEALPGLLNAQAKRNDYTVQDDGAIAVPDVGRIPVAGLTQQEAEADIFQGLVSAGIDPSFSLEITGFNSQRVAIGGEVRAPQLVPITLKPLFLHEALQVAGGTAVADTGVARVQLTRQGDIYQLGLDRVRSDPAARQILLLDGDSVMVLRDYREDAAALRFRQELDLRGQAISTFDFRLQAEALRQQREQAARAALQAEREVFRERLDLGAVKRDRAYLVGEVGRTARYDLPFESTATLADILFDNTILNIETADFAEIYLLRAETDPALAGGLTAYRLNAENAVNFAMAGVIELRPNDVVFVAEQPVTSWNRVLSQILPSLLTTVTRAATGDL